MKQPLLSKLRALMDSYLKNSKLVPLFRVFSKSKKIVKAQAFNVKSLLCGGKRNNKIKLNTNKTIAFLQSLLVPIRVSLILKRVLVGIIISLD